MTEMIELIEKNFKRAIINMLKNSRENLKTIRREIKDIKRNQTGHLGLKK